MRLVEFVTDQQAELIRKDCQPYLKIANGLSIFRGMKLNGADFVKKTSHLSGRRPMDSTRSVHNKVNTIFKQRFGYEFRNAVFVTGDDGIAENYGSIYKIWPIGEFKFLWSPSIKDMTSVAAKKATSLTFLGFFLSLISKDTTRDEEQIKMAEKGNYKMDNLPAAIKSGNEIMLWCDSYYAERVNHK